MVRRGCTVGACDAHVPPGGARERRRRCDSSDPRQPRGGRVSSRSLGPGGTGSRRRLRGGDADGPAAATGVLAVCPSPRTSLARERGRGPRRRGGGTDARGGARDGGGEDPQHLGARSPRALARSPSRDRGPPRTMREQLLRGGVAEPGSMRFVPDEIEALVALGRLDEADEVLCWLEERARALDRASALAAAARCRGLVAAASGDNRTTAVEQLRWERLRIPPAAPARFAAVGATAPREADAAREAPGSGAHVVDGPGGIWPRGLSAPQDRTRTAPPDELTPTEQRSPARRGRPTNKEVASALFDHRAAEAHLRHLPAGGTTRRERRYVRSARERPRGDGRDRVAPLALVGRADGACAVLERRVPESRVPVLAPGPGERRPRRGSWTSA